MNNLRKLLSHNPISKYFANKTSDIAQHDIVSQELLITLYKSIHVVILSGFFFEYGRNNTLNLSEFLDKI
jgi:hypothetical protein